MATAAQRPKLLAIVGPTASGKSGLAMKIALQYGGEVICADSRTVYKGMDIGTAKPSASDQKAVRHWGLDLVEPGRRFTAADFKRYADAAIADIQNRGKLPILVGGTGLYIDGVLFDFSFIPRPGLGIRSRLESLSTEELQAEIRDRGYRMPVNSQNRRHLVRTIEREGETGSRKPNIPESVLLVGLIPPDEILRARILERAEEIFKSGVVKETKKLVKRYGRDNFQSTAGIVYKISLKLIEGEINQKAAIELFKTADWQYARRQKTWFKRNPYIKWFESAEKANNFIEKFWVNT